MNSQAPHDLDPALASDKLFLSEKIQVAKASGGYTFGFKTSSEARKARRRMYHVITQMAAFDQGLANEVEFQLKGRTIAIVPKPMLSTIIQDTEEPNDHE